MNQTDRVISNIGMIKTMVENFPMGIFDKDGKTYESAFDFVMDIIRCCGISDSQIIQYIISKIFGVEGKPGMTINGLYDYINRQDFTFEQNEFMSTLEFSIKSILMALFSSVYTCSAIPILPNKVFDLNTSIQGLMSSTVKNITIENNSNDYNYKLKIPMSTIDMIGMLSISPATRDGRLYYSVDGHDVYYKKTLITNTYKTPERIEVNPGDKYIDSGLKYCDVYQIKFIYEKSNLRSMVSYAILDASNFHTTAPFDIEITTIYLPGGSDSICTKKLIIYKGRTYTEKINNENEFVNDFIYVNSTGPNNSSSVIYSIKINGFNKGFEYGTKNGEKIWIYLSNTGNGPTSWKSDGGSPIPNMIFGTDRSDELYEIEKIATEPTEVTALVEHEERFLSYVTVDSKKEKTTEAVRYTYVPDRSVIDENSPDLIVCYEGISPTLLYRAYDMNAFIWYCINRGNKTNQIEENHLMWDSRISARKNGIERINGEDWNRWYSSKSQEGNSFKFQLDENSNAIYPIIQIEKYNNSTILVRIPSQRYFLPKKRDDIINGEYNQDESNNFKYFNASVYKYDWEYLKNIQILNPRLLLVRFVEHLLGFTIESASSFKFSITKKKIEAALGKAIYSIITANDMEVEDCWKSFSNEDFNDLLNEMVLSRYTASEYNGEVYKGRQHNLQDYFDKLDNINSDSETQGTVKNVTRLVNDIMMIPGTEPENKGWGFEYGFDSNMLERFIWAIVMPIVESIFTPQVMLLMMINFQLFGLVNIDDAFGQDFGKIINLLINKVLGLVKSIVLFVKDKIIEILLDFFTEVVLPLIKKYEIMTYLERITDWTIILLDALKCMQNIVGIVQTKPIGYIEDVEYADIVNEQIIPENSSEC